MNKKLLFDTFEIYDEYERRYAKARAEKKLRNPWVEEDRKEIRDLTTRVLGIKGYSYPRIKAQLQGEIKFNGYKVKNYLFESFENTFGAFTIYLPDGEGKFPLVFNIPGHGAYGRLTEDVQALAMRLVKQGSAVVSVDLLGRGERERFGHWTVPQVFQTGITLQGMIILELIGLIKYFKNQPFVDVERIGAAGNSGGGTATLFLSGLCDDLQAIASTGYPSEFSYILQKERPHCSCNVLKGFAKNLDMWEIYSLFAPRPLLLEQGEFDNLIPYDYFARNGRKVKTVYTMMGAEENFHLEETQVKHPWTTFDRYFIADFFSKHFGIGKAVPAKTDSDDINSDEYLDHGKKYITFPENAVDTIATAEIITGKKVDRTKNLWDVFRPEFKGEKIAPEQVVDNLGRGNVMQVLAQFEAGLEDI